MFNRDNEYYKQQCCMMGAEWNPDTQSATWKVERRGIRRMLARWLKWKPLTRTIHKYSLPHVAIDGMYLIDEPKTKQKG